MLRVNGDPRVHDLNLSFKRIAVFGGIYNNYLALEAAILDAKERKVEAIFCLGDLGGFGPLPDRVFPLLRDHSVYVMQGNYDISIGNRLEDCGCGYTDPRDNHFAQVSYDYTLANTSPANREWLRELPPAYSFHLGQTKVLTCHGSPRQTNEFLWESASPDGLLEMFCRESGADLILGTHTGIKWQRRLPQNCGFVNVGVLGRPENDGTKNVWYTVLESDETRGWKAEFIPVHYDHEKLAQVMLRENLPQEFVDTIRNGWWTTCLEILPTKERLVGQF